MVDRSFGYYGPVLLLVLNTDLRQRSCNTGAIEDVPSLEASIVISNSSGGIKSIKLSLNCAAALVTAEHAVAGKVLICTSFAIAFDFSVSFHCLSFI